MAISREKKDELLERYKEALDKSPGIVLTNYRGISVSQIQALRTKLQETGATYMVIKNSLLRIALEQTGKGEPDGLLTGPNAVAFLGEDVGKSVKALQDWIKAEKIGEITGAILGGSTLDAQRAEALADLPTREQVLAMILGAINGPAGGLARIINAPGASLARVINAHIEQQQEVEAA